VREEWARGGGGGAGFPRPPPSGFRRGKLVSDFSHGISTAQ